MDNNKTLDTLAIIRENSRKQQEKGDKIDAFLDILTTSEREEFLTLKLDSDKEAFINKVMLSRSNALRGKISSISIESKIAKDVMDIDSKNLAEYLETKKTEELEAELSTGINQLVREYTAKCSNIFCEKRNKRSANGKLDIYLSMEEHFKIKGEVSRKLMSNPVYKLSLMTINNAAGTISVFNDKMVESRRDYEILKMSYCNEKGMTPESFDAWQEFVKVSYRSSILEDEQNGFSNLSKFGEEWHREVFKKFYKRFKGFEKGKTLVYDSEFLRSLDEYDKEKLSKSTNEVTKEILEKFDQGMIKYNPLNMDETDKKIALAGGAEIPVNRSSKLKEAIAARKKNLIEHKAKEEKVEVKEEPKKEITRSFLDYVKKEDKKVEEVLEDEKTLKSPEMDESLTDTHEDELRAFKGALNEDLGHSKGILIDPPDELIEEIEEKVIEKPSTSEIVVNVVNPDNKLKAFRNDQIESEVLVRYSRKPDTSILKNISNPNVRLKMYKESAVVNGFKIYLPYSGYEVIVKRLVDKSKLSYLFTMIDNALSQDEMASFIEHETLKILYECLEFPSFTADVSYSDFIKNLSEGDLPILMVALAMTNITENKDGRVVLDFKSLKCSDPTCSAHMPLSGISIDLKDLFSKIYPVNMFNKISKNTMTKTDIYDAYRATDAGEIRMVEADDKEGICSHSIYFSKPTIYKENVTEDKKAETNFNIIRDDIMERDEYYVKSYGIEKLSEYISNITFEDYKEISTKLAMYITSLNHSIEDFSDEEKETIETFLKDNMSEVNVISKLLETNNLKLNRLYNICKFIDGIIIKSVDDGEVISKIENCQEDLFNTIKLISEMPMELVNELEKRVNELGTTYKFEYENVYYNSEDIKNRIDRAYIERYAPSGDKEFIAWLKENNPGIGEKEIEYELNQRSIIYKRLTEGKCVCGGSSFYLNYISVVFFSISNL